MRTTNGTERIHEEFCHGINVRIVFPWAETVPIQPMNLDMDT